MPPLPDAKQLKEILSRVRAVYTQLAARPVERNCTGRAECCHFKLTGRTPHLTRGEAHLAAQAWKATGRKALPSKTDGACPFLSPEQKCLIYDSRPFGCRTHFCAAAGGPYSRREVLDLIRELEEIDRLLGGKGPLSLETALAAVR
ncbi:MAG: YkgJ family cysteine cluster protein [Verrucomicrobiae bacterium]|nr:YkgJ family cysteine cluster protein [Verrucomicrobiae bacterium]